MNEKYFEKFTDMKKLAFALGFYSSFSILGPLLLLGGIGFVLDKYFGTYPRMLLIGIAIAFVFTNILLFRKVKALTNWINKQAIKKKSEDKK